MELLLFIFNFWTANVEKTNPGFGVYQKLSINLRVDTDRESYSK